MLRAPDGTPLKPDVVWFNFGFHSLNENAVRPEYGLRNYESVYEADLDRVTSMLTNWSLDPRHGESPPTLIFGLTTPMLFSVHADDVIRRHNVSLASAAHKWPCLPYHNPNPNPNPNLTPTLTLTLTPTPTPTLTLCLLA